MAAEAFLCRAQRVKKSPRKLIFRGQRASLSRVRLFDVEGEIVYNKRCLQRTIFRAHQVNLDGLAFIRRHVKALQGIARRGADIGVSRQSRQHSAR